jgi:hypothetical protein
MNGIAGMIRYNPPLCMWLLTTCVPSDLDPYTTTGMRRLADRAGNPSLITGISTKSDSYLLLILLPHIHIISQSPRTYDPFLIPLSLCVD